MQRHWWGVSGKALSADTCYAVYRLDLFGGRRVADIGSSASGVQTCAGVTELCLPWFQRPAEAGRRCSRAPSGVSVCRASGRQSTAGDGSRRWVPLEIRAYHFLLLNLVEENCQDIQE
ncbi:hypothetical protein NDU88_001326 [Pleurodeles waltl]|uniref:Uncharacterized protein n=1 Tax=Pleurodeles waltl TaxID=8319 RepID=A0AAV7Q401_PLEWA|nr:hypothetical protein NDU88_001326 [Pleurodeles waltl]